MRAIPDVDALLAELLQAGVSPKYVARLASELDDHRADLEEEAKRLGVAECDAATDARERLGNCSHIAQEFERRPELKSWVYTSRWLERLLRLVGAAYLLLRAPARVLAAGQGVMLRYTAATAAGSSVTFAILLLLTSMMHPDSQWGMRLVERAGAALAAWQTERTSRAAERRDGAAAEQASEPAVPQTDATREAPAPASSSSEAVSERIELQDPVFFARPAFSHRAPRLPDLRLPDDLYPPKRPSYVQARVVLADLEPSIHLGIDDDEFKPIIEAPPTYPPAAIRRGLEGRVVLEYTVTRTGLVRDAIVVESSNPVFNRAALDAARDFKYEPLMIRGQTVDVRGVRIVIRFELEA